MKKIFCTACIIVAVSLVCSCASTSKAAEGATEEPVANAETVTEFAEESVSPASPVEEEAPKGFLESERKTYVQTEIVGVGQVVQKKVYEDLLTDPVTGAEYLKRDKLNLRKGKVHLQLDSYTGTIKLSIIPREVEEISAEEAAMNEAEGKVVDNRKAREEYVFSLSEKSQGSYFSVLVGKREHRLVRKDGARAECRLTEYGAQMAYKVSGKLQFIVDFHFLSSYGTEESDVLEVALYAVNTGKKTKNFAVKAVFDTGLGQKEKVMYTTALNTPINTEMDLERLATDKWIKVSNRDASAKFLLSGNGVTPVDSVYIAKSETLQGTSFVPNVKNNGSISSITSYNDSGIAVIWPMCKVSPKKFRCDKFYISLGQGQDEPVDSLFLVKQASLPLDCYADAVSEGETQVDVSVSDGRGQYVQSQPTYTKEFLEPYHQRLEAITARINQLEKDPTVANQAEIERLSAELDKIISELRSYN